MTDTQPSSEYEVKAAEALAKFREEVKELPWDQLRNRELDCVADLRISAERRKRVAEFTSNYKGVAIGSVNAPSISEYIEAASGAGLIPHAWVDDEGRFSFVPEAAMGAKYSRLISNELAMSRSLPSNWEVAKTIVIRAEQMVRGKELALEAAGRFQQFTKKTVAPTVRWIVLGQEAMQAAKEIQLDLVRDCYEACHGHDSESIDSNALSFMQELVEQLEGWRPADEGDVLLRELDEFLEKSELGQSYSWVDMVCRQYRRCLEGQIQHVSLGTMDPFLRGRTLNDAPSEIFEKSWSALANPYKTLLESWGNGTPIVGLSATDGMTLVVPSYRFTNL